MAKLDITGTWIGEFWYFRNPEFPVLPARTGFTLVADQARCLGRFIGTVQDTAVGDMVPDEASVGGRVAGHRIRFRKQYPKFYVWMDDRLETLSENIKARLGIDLDEEPVTVPIHYRGEYIANEEYVEGTWEVAEYNLRCWSDGRPLDFQMPGYAGGWRMARQPT
jgi:hypothetical protein